MKKEIKILLIIAAISYVGLFAMAVNRYLYPIKHKYCIEVITGNGRSGYCQLTVGDTIDYSHKNPKDTLKIVLTQIP